MGSRAALIAIGIGAFLAFSLVRFPASIAHRWFTRDTLTLASVTGTIWNGTAGHGAIAGIAFSDLDWRLNPLALLTGKLDLIVDSVSLGNGSASAQVVASDSQADVTIIDAITSLQPFQAALSLGDVHGMVSTRRLDLRIVDGWPVAAAGEFRVADLAVPPLIPVQGVERVLLGNFRGAFAEGTDPGIVILLNDEGGPIELEGTFRLEQDRTFALDTVVQPRADAADVLVEGLRMWSGEPDAQGKWSFRQSGSL